MSSRPRPSVSLCVAPMNVAKRILSVDDEPTVLFLHQQLLEGAGYEVISMADGEQALRTFAKNSVRIDLVLLDYALPGRDGGAVAREMKRCRPQVPILLVSGYLVAEETLSSVDGFLWKGARAALLLSKVGQLLAEFSREPSKLKGTA